MTARDTILIFGCSEQSSGTMEETSGKSFQIRKAESVSALARDAAKRRPAAIVLGIDSKSAATLDAIDAIHAIRETIPVIVIASDDSLDTERRSREKNIFYYFVEPIDPAELIAVLDDALRYKC